MKNTIVVIGGDGFVGSNLAHNQEDLPILMILLRHAIMLGKKSVVITPYQIKQVILL